MFFPLVYSFFSFFFQSLLDTCNFSSTLEKSGWREKVFISSVLEPFNFSPARSNNCPLNFSRFSVPRSRTSLPSFSFFLPLVFYQSECQERNCTSRYFCLLETKIPLFRSLLPSIRISKKKTLRREK